MNESQILKENLISKQTQITNKPHNLKDDQICNETLITNKPQSLKKPQIMNEPQNLKDRQISKRTQITNVAQAPPSRGSGFKLLVGSLVCHLNFPLAKAPKSELTQSGNCWDKRCGSLIPWFEVRLNARL